MLLDKTNSHFNKQKNRKKNKEENLRLNIQYHQGSTKLRDYKTIGRRQHPGDRNETSTVTHDDL